MPCILYYLLSPMCYLICSLYMFIIHHSQNNIGWKWQWGGGQWGGGGWRRRRRNQSYRKTLFREIGGMYLLLVSFSSFDRGIPH